MNTQTTGKIRPQIPAINPSRRLDKNTQDLTQLTQAFIALSGSFAALHSFEGIAHENQPHQYDDLICNAQTLIEAAEKLRTEKREANQAFIAGLFSAVPMASGGEVTA